jgi:hypothetical protein
LYPKVSHNLHFNSLLQVSDRKIRPWKRFFVAFVLSFFYKMRTLVLGVFARKPAFIVLDKISLRDLFHVIRKSILFSPFFRVGSVARSVVFPFSFPSRIQLEVSLG